ncbi:MAG: 2-oxoglutarate dehydrogenase, E2 component, dihydrolipoamide succinyltransferase [Actinomycetota bacterium]|nr:2-oxoglutarate dehydrogenase, E2 component, dihydrolipoamide succinyltransferase [Actinomycetota bacterium]
MPVSVTMPRLGESVSEGTVTRWLKNEGDQVEADEPLLEVSTDKVDTEIPAPASGVLSAIKVREDETVEVGAELATIDEGGGGDAKQEQEQEQEHPEPEQQPEQEQPEAQQEPKQEQPEAQQEQEQEQEQEHGQQQHQPAGSVDDDQGAYVTPLVRKLAAEHGVDLADVEGTGVGGRIRKQDVLDAARSTAPPAAEEQGPAAEPARSPEPAPAASAPAAPPGVPAATAPAAASALRGQTVKMSRLRTVIAERMLDSLRASAQLTTVAEADLTRVARLRQRVRAEFEAQNGVKLSFLPFFALATVEALKAHPSVNASIDVEQGTITYHDAEHLGIAVDTERGLLVPVIRDAGDLNLGGLARKIADLAQRTRAGKVSPDELGGGTFTLTNTGSRGALFDTPIINQPQVGILGTGSVVKRPVVVDDPDLGEIVTVRSMVYLALTYDHRLVDGADAARFLGTVKDRLEGGGFESSLGV